MTPTLWGTLIAGALTVLGSYLVARTTGRTTIKAAETAADEGAFLRAKEIYDGAIDQQDERINRIVEDLKSTREQLGETVRDLAETRRDLKAAREEISTLRRSVSQYEGRVIQLTEVLRLHNIDVPPWTLNPSDYGMLPGSIPDPNEPARTSGVDADPTLGG
jgi:hypothetical protein